MTELITNYEGISFFVLGALLASSITIKNKSLPWWRIDDVDDLPPALFVWVILFWILFWLTASNLLNHITVLKLTVGIIVVRIVWHFRQKLFVAPYQKYRTRFIKHVPSSH